MLLAACGSSTPPSRATDAKVVSSNIWRADYVGSAACEDCHHEVYAKWATSPMRNMTRDIADATVVAPFDGASLRIGRDTATMTMEAGARVVKVASPIGVETFTVTKVVGGHYREDFIGRSAPTAEERVLPATYVFATKSWRYKGYSVMVKERPEMSTNAVWSQECIACHNTLPLGTTLYDELYGPGAPPYQANLADRTLPSRLKWNVTPTSEPGLVSRLADEMAFLGASRPTATDLKSVLAAASRASEDHLDGGKLVELGVGCEACHNGARVHAMNPDVMPAYGAVAPELAVTPPPRHDGGRAQEINHTCAKCHTVLFSQYPWTWEGGTRTQHMGGSTTNSGEGRDFLLGGCSKAMTCTTCHDPHTVDPRARLDAMGTVKANVLCTECHAEVGANLSAHTHHETSSAGSSCIGCHMAKKNMGLDYELVRYHRIGSPTDVKRVEGDRPLECALCHADKSVRVLADTMKQWWPRTQIDADALARLYGSLDANAIRATLDLGKPHEQAVALATLGTSGTPADIPLVAEHLAHEYPLVRYYAHRALEKLTGGPVPIDVGQSAGDVRAATAAWLKRRR